MRAVSLSLLTSVVFLSCAAKQPTCNGECNSEALRTQSDSVSLLQSRGIRVEFANDAASSGSSLTVSSQQALPPVKALDAVRAAPTQSKAVDTAKAAPLPVKGLDAAEAAEAVELSHPSAQKESHVIQAAAAAQSIHHSPTLVQNAVPALLARQIWVETIHSGWSIGIVTTMLSGLLWLLCLGKLDRKSAGQDPLEERVKSVLHPQTVGGEPDRPSRMRAPSSSSFDFMVSGSSHTCRAELPTMEGQADQLATEK